MPHPDSKRRFSFPDFLIMPTFAASLLMLILIIVNVTSSDRYGSIGAWAMQAIVLLCLTFCLAVTGYILSFKNRNWLWAVHIFGAAQVAQVCFRVYPMHSPTQGMDLIWLILGVTLTICAELIRRDILPMSGQITGSEIKSPEERLKQLKHLHEIGLLSDVEYADERKEILANLNT